MKPKILMCAPDFFDVTYSINPWMKPEEANVMQQKAKEQWGELKRVFEELGADVELVKPQPGLPDMVYVDVGIAWDKFFIPSNFKCKERQGERPYVVEHFKNAGFEIKDLSDEYTLEGHGDTLWDGDRLYCGHGFRSQKEAHAELANIFSDIGAKVDIVPVELTDERLYHLDTTFCPLEDGSALIYRKGVTEGSLKELEEKLELVDVPEEEALNFACNAVVLKKNIIIPKGAPKTCQKLRARGFTVHEVEMTEFIKGGGACKCLSMPLP